MLADGRELVKQVRVDIRSATVQPIEQQLRGTLDNEKSPGEEKEKSASVGGRSDR